MGQNKLHHPDQLKLVPDDFVLPHRLCSNRIGCPVRRRGRGEAEEAKEEERQEADVKNDQKDKRAEDEMSALHLLKKPLPEPKKEEG